MPDKHHKRMRMQGLFAGIARRLKPGAAGPGVIPISSRLATWVGIGSACIGGFLGLDTYQADVDKKVDQSVAQSFGLVLQYNAPELVEPRRRTLSYVDAKRYCDARYIDRELTDADFIAVLDFFDLVYACAESGLCDRPTADRFFGPYANYQWPILVETVAEMRSQEQSIRADSNFGEGMKSFASEPTSAPPCDGNF